MKKNKSKTRLKYCGLLFAIIMAALLFTTCDANETDSLTPGLTGTKTMTVKGGLGKLPDNTAANDVYDATRDITVTVSLLDGKITNVAINHPIGWPNFPENNPFRIDANALAAAIKIANNPNAGFSPVNAYSGRAAEAWKKHESAIRQAVKDAITALKNEKPNRILAGGGNSSFWTAGGENLSGDAVITGSGNNTIGGEIAGTILPTDFSVHVTVTDGVITGITAEGEETLSEYNGYPHNPSLPSMIATGTLTDWPALIIEENDPNALDAISGATNTTRAMRDLIIRGMEKIANEY